MALPEYLLTKKSSFLGKETGFFAYRMKIIYQRVVRAISRFNIKI